MKKDPELIGKSIKDVIVEPARKHMIPGFSKVKENALKAGALGVTISGAGLSPSALNAAAAIATCKGLSDKSLPKAVASTSSSPGAHGSTARRM